VLSLVANPQCIRLLSSIQSFGGSAGGPTRGGFSDLGTLFCGIHVLDRSLPSDKNRVAGAAAIAVVIVNFASNVVCRLELLAGRLGSALLAARVLSAIIYSGGLAYWSCCRGNID